MSPPDTSLQKLISMANQIGAVFIAQDTGTASARIAEVLGSAHARRDYRPSRQGR
jgi:hypothetical protein